MSAMSRVSEIKGRVAYRKGNLSEAVRSYRSAWEGSDRTDADLAHRLGAASLKAGDVDGAVQGFEAAARLVPTDPERWYKLGFSLERAKKWAEALEAYDRAREISPDEARLSFRAARCLERLGRPDDAIAAYHGALRGGFSVDESHDAIFRLQKKAPLWKRLQLLRAGEASHAGSFAWAADIAAHEYQMGHYPEAVEAFETARGLGELTEKQRTDHAIALIESGSVSAGDAMLAQAAVVSASDEVKSLGAGRLMALKGRWKDAIRLYRETLDETDGPVARASIQFEIGHCYDRQYLWAEAADWFRESLHSDREQAYRQYRLGVLLERLAEYPESIGAYSYALRLDPTRKHWWFRLAEVFRVVDDLESAADAYMRSLGQNGWKATPGPSVKGSKAAPTGQPEHARAADDYVRTSIEQRVEKHPTDPLSWQELALSPLTDRERALEAVREEARRTDALSTRRRVAIARMLLDSGAMLEGIELLRSSRKFTLPDGLDLKRYTNTPAQRRGALFAELQSTFPVDDSTVLLESNHGASIGCHPLALFREMISDPRFAGKTFVWSHTAAARIPQEVAGHPDVVLVLLHSDSYLYHLATAGTLISNVSFAPYFVRREGQRYLNTWHGTPLKTLGRSMKQGLLEYENLARNFVQSTHLMAPNELTRWALLEDHGIDAYFSGAAAVTGSPRLDRLVRDDGTIRRQIRDRLGVADGERLVLFAPTWRGGVSDQTFDEQELLKDLEAISGIDGVRPFYRAHRLTEKFVRSVRVPVATVPGDIDTNDLLCAVDVLISDYSSISFDFLPTRRRIVLYVPDQDVYEAERGLYLPPEELPATICRDRDALRGALESAVDPVRAERFDEALEKYAPLEDGFASRRVLDLLLDEEPAEDTRPLLVFHASLIANGIAAAFVALMEALTPDRYRVVLILEAGVFRKDDGRQLYLDRLPAHVNIAFRVGALVATPEEQWAVGRNGEHDVERSPRIEELVSRAWSREGRRILGGAHPAAAIEFDGYAKLWADLVASLGDASTKHLIWQHNQLFDEAWDKYPELYQVFRRYRRFDEVVSVADSLAVENRAKLEGAGLLTGTEIVSVPNVLPVDMIEARSLEPAPAGISEWMLEAERNVVAIGRLSPEKNFSSLVGAWARLVEDFPRARLTILGEGLERAQLEDQVGRAGIAESVRLFGQVENPYPIIRAADLFVLPSTHEGQPVVLFEAMALGVPVACCYTPGSEEAVRSGYGVVVDSDPEGMAARLVEILRDTSVASGEFDGQARREAAVTAFVERAGVRSEPHAHCADIAGQITRDDESNDE